MANFQRDGQMAFYNQGSRPNYLSSIEPISFRERSVNLDKIHGHFTGKAVTFLSEIRPEDFNAPRALWEKVFDDGARERFISNISGHMENCSEKEIIKRVIGIFREVSEDLASRLEKATGVKGYPGISELKFNGSLNGMAKDKTFRPANGVNKEPGANGAPVKGTNAEFTHNEKKQ
jgi:catalase